MAREAAQLEAISCSICLDLLQDPVTIPCGHSYCMNCIRCYWDKKKTHSCPQCRQPFTPRPVLVKSTVLADLVEQLKTTGLQAAPADHCYAGPGDVACDFCTGRKLKAFKSCLVCLVSYCETHIQPHYDIAQLRKHQLVEPSRNLQENLCSHHNEVMRMFCRTDQRCICYLCPVDQHKGHDTVSAAAEMSERQSELERSRQKIQQRVQDREENVKVLQDMVQGISHAADKTLEDSEKMFIELISFVQKRRTEVKLQIRSHQETQVSRVKQLQEKLEQELAELKRRDAELEQLSHTDDHNQFLLNYFSLSAFNEPTDVSSLNISLLGNFEDAYLSDLLRDKLKYILAQIMPLTEIKAEVVLSNSQAEPKTRAEFLKYSHEVTLDENTAHKSLKLSQSNRRVTPVNQPQLYSDHPDRFCEVPQVLSRETLTGRCYWEVEWSGGGGLHSSRIQDHQQNRKKYSKFIWLQ